MKSAAVDNGGTFLPENDQNDEKCKKQIDENCAICYNAYIR